MKKEMISWEDSLKEALKFNRTNSKSGRGEKYWNSVIDVIKIYLKSWEPVEIVGVPMEEVPPFTRGNIVGKESWRGVTIRFVNAVFKTSRGWEMLVANRPWYDERLMVKHSKKVSCDGWYLIK